MEKTQLEVGDKIVKHGRTGLSMLTIDRVTPKRAYGGGREFKRQITGVQAQAKYILDEIGYSSIGFRLYVPAIHDKLISRQNLEVKAKRIFDSVSIENLPNETLEKVIELLTPKE